MSSNKNGSSSDLEMARRAARRLAGTTREGAETDGQGYVRFSASSFETAAREISRPAPPDRFGPALWNDMLDECLAAAHAELAFVTDDNGLVVASRGEMDTALVQGIGARLIIAFEQAAQMAEMGTTSQSLAIEFGERWLTGLRIKRGDSQVFTIGVLGRSVVTRETRRTLEKMLGGK